jgi:hypothetical protein
LARDHDCKWKRLAEDLTGRLATQSTAHDAIVADRDKQIAVLVLRIHKLEHEAALAKKQIVGPKRERMPECDAATDACEVPSRMPTPEDEAKSVSPVVRSVASVG